MPSRVAASISSRFLAYVDFATDNVVRVGLRPICREQDRALEGLEFSLAFNPVDANPFDHGIDPEVEYPEVKYPNCLTLTPRDGINLSDDVFGVDINVNDFIPDTLRF